MRPVLRRFVTAAALCGLPAAASAQYKAHMEKDAIVIDAGQPLPVLGTFETDDINQVYRVVNPSILPASFALPVNDTGRYCGVGYIEVRQEGHRPGNVFIMPVAVFKLADTKIDEKTGESGFALYTLTEAGRDASLTAMDEAAQDLRRAITSIRWKPESALDYPYYRAVDCVPEGDRPVRQQTTARFSMLVPRS